MAANFTVKGAVTYHASKVFVNYLIRAVQYELDKAKSAVEILTLMPAAVETNMTRQADIMNRVGPTLKSLVGIVSTTTCVKCALRDIGRDYETYGAFPHEF